eukprot:scaffold1371_cov400-Prasinococcus_capsulatus_cf.AAC.10
MLLLLRNTCASWPTTLRARPRAITLTPQYPNPRRRRHQCPARPRVWGRKRRLARLRRLNRGPRRRPAGWGSCARSRRPAGPVHADPARRRPASGVGASGPGRQRERIGISLHMKFHCGKFV